MKFHVVEEAKEAVLYFETRQVNFWQLNVLIYLY